jgi:hypothetical protein
MSEPALYNETDFHADFLPIVDRDGARARVAIVKATYVVGPRQPPSLAPKQRAVRLGDEVWGPPEIPDIRLPADFCAVKPGTDFVLSGHVVPPSDFTGTYMDLQIRVAEREMALRVHGERVWQRSAVGVVPGASRVLTPTPLAWSLAFGGRDLSDPARPLEEPRNPVGSGIARDVRTLIGMPAPRIEAPRAPIGAADADNLPAGCAALGRNFAPRRNTAGTYGKDYIDAVYPAKPRDYQEEHENCAPPEFVFRQPLRGGERVSCVNITRERSLDFVLPKWRLLIEAEIDGGVIARRPHLDTVLLNTDAMQLELVWRGLFRCPPKMHGRFTAVRIRTKEYLS